MTTARWPKVEEPRAGLVTFTDDRVNIFSRERELGVEQKHKDLRAILEGRGFCVVDAMERLRGPLVRGLVRFSQPHGSPCRHRLFAGGTRRVLRDRVSLRQKRLIEDGDSGR